jgi:hypothetical protein
MEITRSIEKEKVQKIMIEYKENNFEEILRFNRILKDLERKLTVGQKMLNERYNYQCGEIIDKIIKNFPETNMLNDSSIDTLINLLSDKNKNYDTKSFYLDQLKRCKKYSQPKFEKSHLNLKQKFDSIKSREKQMFSKCVVLEYDEASIKNCLYNEFKKFQIETVDDIKEYYDEIEKFKKYIYI